MAPSAVQLQQLKSIPIAVIRRQARPSELSRVVPECCGLVWNAVRAQQTKGGRHIAIYWDSGIRLEVGVELLGPFAEDGEVILSATPAGAVASATHLGPYSGSARRTTQFASGAEPTTTTSPAQTGRSTATGNPSGTPTHRRFALTSTISWPVDAARRVSHPYSLIVESYRTPGGASEQSFARWSG